MADYYKYDRDRGLITVDTSTLKAEIQGEFKSALGSNLDLSDSTPQGRMIDAETAARAGVLNYTAGVANQINPNWAGGVFLASIFSLMGGSPFKAIPTTIPQVRIYGNQGEVSPSGLQIYNNSGEFFAQQTSAVINNPDTSTSPTTYYAVADFDAIIPGPVVVAENTRWLILQPQPGFIEEVVNPFPGVIGSDAESDVEARNRRRNILAKQGSNTIRSIRANVSDLTGFRSMTIRENYSWTEQVIDGVTMPPNSVYTCIQGAQDMDIAKALLESKSTGVPWTLGTPVRGAGVTVNAMEPASGQLYEVSFARPDIVECTCKVYYDSSQSTGNYEPNFCIQDAINKYQNGAIDGDPGLVVGRNIAAHELSGSVSVLYPGIFISEVQVTGKGIVDGIEIAIDVWEQAYIPVGSIEVIQRSA